MMVKVVCRQLFLQFKNLVFAINLILKSKHLTSVANITLIDLKMLKSLGLFVEMMTKQNWQGKVLNSCLVKGIDKVVRNKYTYA
jgi:hypothetical protein